MKTVPLSQGKFAQVDDSDYPFICQFKWYFIKSGYAVRKDSEGRTIYMHRQIAMATESQYVDHINHDKLDNQRVNLRAVSPQQSVMNRRVQKNNKCGIKGIRWESDRQKWSARIGLNRKTIHLGRFNTPSEAKAAYGRAAKQLHGEHACCN